MRPSLTAYLDRYRHVATSDNVTTAISLFVFAASVEIAVRALWTAYEWPWSVDGSDDIALYLLPRLAVSLPLYLFSAFILKETFPRLWTWSVARPWMAATVGLPLFTLGQWLADIFYTAQIWQGVMGPILMGFVALVGKGAAEGEDAVAPRESSRWEPASSDSRAGLLAHSHFSSAAPPTVSSPEI